MFKPISIILGLKQNFMKLACNLVLFYWVTSETKSSCDNIPPTFVKGGHWNKSPICLDTWTKSPLIGLANFS